MKTLGFDTLSPAYAEVVVLGAVLFSPVILPEVAASVGDRDLFTLPSHGRIWRALRALQATGTDATLEAVKAQIMAQGGTEADQVKAHDLAAAAFTASTWPHFLEQMQRHAQRRQIKEALEHGLFMDAQNESNQDILERVGDMLGKAVNAVGGPRSVRLADADDRVIAGLEQALPSVFRTGLSEFDREYAGIPRGHVTTILGVPGSGKSSLALQLAIRIADYGTPVRFFSYEMGAESLASNALSHDARVCVNHFRRSGARPTAEQMELIKGARHLHEKLDLELVEEPLSASEIASRCGLYAARGVGVVVIDYLQNLPSTETDDVKRIESACRTIQRIARDRGMTVLAVSQLTASAARDDRPPRKSDGVGSGAIEQVSDLMIGVYRPCVLQVRRPDETDRDWDARRLVAEIHVLKNKQGPCGAVECEFEGKHFRWSDKGTNWNSL